ncbi:MAG: hypothetical protein IIY78_10170 [Clostridia bacterium]|nr:hypothetical protein [Clostridia bacterium]
MKPETKKTIKETKETLDILSSSEELNLPDEYKKAITEIVSVIDHSTDGIKKSIPEELVEGLRRRSDKKYSFDGNDLSKVSHLTKTIISMIYLVYLCNSEEEQDEFCDQLERNQKEYEMKMYESMMEDEDE